MTSLKQARSLYDLSQETVIASVTKTLNELVDKNDNLDFATADEIAQLRSYLDRLTEGELKDDLATKIFWYLWTQELLYSLHRF